MFPLNRIAASLLLAATVAAPALAQMPSGGPNQADITISAERRQHIIDTLLSELKLKYVFPDQARALEGSIRARVARGEYRDITSAKQLAATLTGHLQADSKDKHLMLAYSERPIPLQAQTQGESPEQLAQELAHMKTMNFGIDRVQRLPFNIAYLELGTFARASIAAEALAAAMQLVTNSDALIVDLRRNGGGDPDTVALLASYFLEKRTHLSDIYFRKGDRTVQMWTTDKLAGARYGKNKPVYVLTSSDSFSAAEDFSYTLKHLKRVTVVGETTGGGAHPGDMERIDANFAANVPNGRTINIVTKSNWEGTGVAPDLAVVADDALKAAQKDILRKMIEAERNPGRAERMKARMAAIDKEAS